MLGFEPSCAQLVTAVVTAYGLELLLEWIQSRIDHRPARFASDITSLMDFLLPAHITGLAVSMLLYSNDRLLPFAFASAVAIGSKAILTAPTGKTRCRFMNPSNFGLVVAYLILPETVAGVVPYQYTADLSGSGDWLLPVIVVCSGSFVNWRFTRRLPLVLAWVGGFALQAVVRHQLLGAALLPALAPMTGMAFVLFTFYMIPDPGTTPSSVGGQMHFGLAPSAVYSVLVCLHITFALFSGLAVVCMVRGIGLLLKPMRDRIEHGLLAAR